MGSHVLELPHGNLWTRPQIESLFKVIVPALRAGTVCSVVSLLLYVNVKAKSCRRDASPVQPSAAACRRPPTSLLQLAASPASTAIIFSLKTLAPYRATRGSTLAPERRDYT